MIEISQISELARSGQTTENNIYREYIQNLILSKLYQCRKSEELFFKGGTALRLVYNSPRFSEDLDFSSRKIIKIEIEKILEEIMEWLTIQNINVDLLTADSTSGGYLSKINVKTLNLSTIIKIEISLRKNMHYTGDFTDVNSNLIPFYAIQILSPQFMVEEKINASLTRSKPRDFFDLLFILRHPILRKYAKFTKQQAVKLLMLLDKDKEKQIIQDVGPFLPQSHKLLLKNIRSRLTQELSLW